MKNCITEIFGIEQSRPAYESSPENILYEEASRMLSQFKHAVTSKSNINAEFVAFCTTNKTMRTSEKFTKEQYSDNTWSKYFACVKSNQDGIDAQNNNILK